MNTSRIGTDVYTIDTTRGTVITKLCNEDLSKAWTDLAHF